MIWTGGSQISLFHRSLLVFVFGAVDATAGLLVSGGGVEVVGGFLLFPLHYVFAADAFPAHDGAQEAAQVAVVGQVDEAQALVVVHHSAVLGRAVAQKALPPAPSGGGRLGLHRLDVLLVGRPLPGQLAAGQLDEGVEPALDVVSSAEFLVAVGVTGCVPDGAFEEDGDARSDQLPVGLDVAAADAEVDDVDLARLVQVGQADAEVAGLK